MDENNKLRIKPQYSLVAHSPDVVELRHGVWNPVSLTLSDDTRSGKLFRLLTRFDGSLSPAQIAKEEKASQEEVEGLLDHLVELGAVELTSTGSLDHYMESMLFPGIPGDAEAESFQAVLLGDPELSAQIQSQLQGTLPKSNISLCPPDDPAARILAQGDTSWFSDSLRFEQTIKTFESWKGKFAIFSTRIIHPGQFRVINRVCHELGISWMHAAVDGPFLFAGPIFVPRRSACYECFERRVLMNLREAASYQRYKQALVERQVRFGRPPVEPVIAGLLASHTALEALNFLLKGNSLLLGKVLAIYLPTMEITYNDVLKVPGCVACGPLAERDGTELYFEMRSLIAN